MLRNNSPNNNPPYKIHPYVTWAASPDPLPIGPHCWNLHTPNYNPLSSSLSHWFARLLKFHSRLARSDKRQGWHNAERAKRNRFLSQRREELVSFETVIYDFGGCFWCLYWRGVIGTVNFICNRESFDLLRGVNDQTFFCVYKIIPDINWYEKIYY